MFSLSILQVTSMKDRLMPTDYRSAAYFFNGIFTQDLSFYFVAGSTTLKRSD